MKRARSLALVAACAVTSAVGALAIGGSAVASSPAPGFGYGAATFEDSAAPSSFSGATTAGEPSIGVDWKTGAAMYMAGTSTARITFDNAQSPPGVTWTDVSSPYSDVNLDPILATDHETGTTIAGGDDGPCAVMSVTTNDGGFLDPTSWTPSTPCPFTADHPTVGMGPYAGTPPVNATAPFVTYFCQQSDVDSCSHSVDGGLTWTPSIPDTGLNCISLFGHVKVSPDGMAYIPSGQCIDAAGNEEVGAITSSDNGQSLSGFAIPNAPAPADGFDPSIATDSSNRVYESWSRASDNLPVVTWSDDHGAHWAPQVQLGTDLPQPLVAATFESAVAGDAGRAAVAFLGTSVGTPGQDPFTSGFQGVWYLYVSYTYDGGASWHTVQADPNPVQRGEIDAGGTTTTGQRNLLDFMGADLTKDGRVIVAYADGCTGSCDTSGTSADSTSSQAAIAYQSTGEGLFSAYDVVPTAAPDAPTLTVASGTSPSLSWTTPNDENSPLTSYQISRGTAPGQETVIGTVAAGTTTFADHTAVAGATYYYRVAGVNAVGVGDPSNEVSATTSSAPTTTVPSAPALTALAGKAQVTLTWTPASDGGSPVTGWSIYRGTTSGGERIIQTLSSGTSYVDTTVTGGTTYFYEVAATNANGTGAPSREVSATPKKGK